MILPAGMSSLSEVSFLIMLTGLIGLIFQDRVTLAAGASVANEFAGQEIEIEDRDVYLELAVVSDAAPTTTSPIFTLVTGPDIVARNRVMSEINRFPQYPEDVTITDAVGGFQRKILQLTNSDSVSHVIRILAKTTPI